MYCDFATVTNMLSNQIVTSSIKSYNGLLNALFSSYLTDSGVTAFHPSESSKLSSGTRVATAKISEYYLKAERSVMIGDIKILLNYFFDKEKLYQSLYSLILNDSLLSKKYKKSVIRKYQPEYTDDSAMADLIYDAVYIAVIRPYSKTDDGYLVKSYFNPDKPDEKFFNHKLVAPCPYFCGRDHELNEFHELIQQERKVIITGDAGIGKSEFVRAYAKKFKSEYANIGYYFYHDSLETVIADMSRSLLNPEERCRQNLEILSAFDEDTLLIIDNFNEPIADNELFENLFNLDCTVILTSHRNYDDVCTYQLREIQNLRDIYELVRKFYPFQMNEESQIRRIIGIVNRHTYAVELCARLLKKGLYTPNSLADKMLQKGMKSVSEKIPSKKDTHQKKQTYHDNIAELFSMAELSEKEKQVLSMMRFVPEYGIKKLLFAHLASLDNLETVESLIETGFVHELEGGLIALPPVVKSIVESDFEIDKNSYISFVDKVFALTDVEAEIVSDLINAISPFKYLEMYDTDYFRVFQKMFECYARLEYFIGMDLTLLQLNELYEENNAEEIAIYEADKAKVYEIASDNPYFDLIKTVIEENERRRKTGDTTPRVKKIIISGLDEDEEENPEPPV